jgi:hypothetical protein
MNLTIGENAAELGITFQMGEIEIESDRELFLQPGEELGDRGLRILIDGR